jgi:hypothetical protein
MRKTNSFMGMHDKAVRRIMGITQEAIRILASLR